jgi:protoporphyrinogen oxidase
LACTRFGRRLYELIFAQYARKIWGDPKTLARSLAETRVAIPGLLPLLWHMLVARNRQRVVHAETFYYPKYGSGQFCDKLADLVIQHGGDIKCSAAVSRVHIEDNNLRVIEANGQPAIEVKPQDIVISTLPVSYFSRLITPALPLPVLEAASQLKTRDLILFYIILNQASVSEDNWIFFPEQKIIFNRLFEQKNFSPFMVPEGRTALCLEIVLDNNERRPSDDELAAQALPVLEELGLIHKAQVAEVLAVL